MKRAWTIFVLAGLLLCVRAPALRAGDGELGARVAAVIERVRKEVDKHLKRAAKAAQEGRFEEALELLEKAVSVSRAGVNAAYNTAGKVPPKLPPKETPESGAPAVPPGDAPDPSKGPALAETYDRFTGEARVAVDTVRISAVHKDTRAKAVILVKYVAWKTENQQVWRALYFGSDDASWGTTGFLAQGQHVKAYFLIDGKRARAELPASAGNLDDNPLQQVTFMLDRAWMGSLVGAQKVEMRIGEQDFELPAAYRAAMKRADERLDSLGE